MAEREEHNGFEVAWIFGWTGDDKRDYLVGSLSFSDSIKYLIATATFQRALSKDRSSHKHERLLQRQH